MSPDASTRADFFGGKRGAALLAEFDAERTPAHIAIIMDGNGRWAQKRGLPRLAGHRAGAKAVRECIASCIETGVSYLTVYSFSSENWSRPRDEVSGLMTLFVEVLERELDNLVKMRVRVQVIGDVAGLPKATADAFGRCVAKTAQMEGLTLVVALNYGGRADVVQATRALAEQVAAGVVSAEDIDEAAVSGALSTAGIPDPDLVIRTSGEMRISNFLLWEIAYAELWVTATLWPDFGRNDLLKAIVDYQKRQRRFGGR